MKIRDERKRVDITMELRYITKGHIFEHFGELYIRGVAADEASPLFPRHYVVTNLSDGSRLNLGSHVRVIARNVTAVIED